MILRCATALLVTLLAACGPQPSSGPGQPQRETPPNTIAPDPAPTPAPAPPPATRPVVFMGDSITALWESIPGVDAGMWGNTSAQMLARFQQDVLSRNPDVVVILGGSNDILLQEMPTTASVQQMADMATAARACVIIGTLPPIYLSLGVGATPTAESTVAPIAAFNLDLGMLARSYGYKIADYHAVLDGHPELFDDGLHPSVEGYERMRQVVQPLIDECRR